ncbi:MAG: hypothetical protein R3C28_14585 [Pirellulaceae bacterium]
MIRFCRWALILAISTVLVQPLEADEALPYARWLDLEPFSLPANELLQAVQELPLPKPEDGTGSPERILLRRQFTTFDDDATRHFENYEIIRCDSNHVTTSGVAWMPQLGEQPMLRMRVINPDGTETRTNPSDIRVQAGTGDLVTPVTEGQIQTCLATMHVKAGSICEIHWRMSRRPENGDCNAYFEVGDSTRAMGCWMEVVDLPKSLEMRHVFNPVYLNNVFRKPDHSADRYRMTTVATDIPPIALHSELQVPVDTFNILFPLWEATSS